jgi:hypothetical protein
VKLTGLELHNDLEALHHVATRGWVDEVAYRRLYGRTPGPIYHALIRLGHPISEERTQRGRAWRWDPEGIYGSRGTGPT